jgi:hypothetical protein
MRAYPVAALLMLMASASSASEAFVPQLSVTRSFGDLSRRYVAGKLPGASAVATPLPLSALKALAPPPVNQTNASYVTQQGNNNLAVVSQTGGRNSSSVVQSGTGNQAIVTQRH